MSKQLLTAFAILLGVITLMGAVPVSAGSQYSTTYSNYLYQPAPAVPAFALPGGTFELHLKSGITVKSIQAVSVLHGPYSLKISGTSGDTVKVSVPEDIAPDEYFLLITTNNGTLVLPNGLRVFKEWPKTLKIAWVSDTHVTSSSKIGYVCGPYFQSYIFDLEKMCSNPIPLHSVVAADSAYTYWAMQNDTLIVNTGDDVDSHSDLVGYDMIYTIMERADADGRTTLSIKGNHDDPPGLYRQILGPPVFYVTIGKFIIIGLDSGGDRGYPTMDEITEMEHILDTHKGYTPIVLYHHPYFFAPRWSYRGGVITGLDPFSDKDWNVIQSKYLGYWSGDKAVARRFLEDVVKYNIPLTLSGHIHHDMYWLYVDKDGHKHYFLTLTSTGAPDKETNPPKVKGHSPTWYGSNLVEISLNGSVEMPYTPVRIDNGKVQNDFISVPVPQEFMVFRHNSDNGTVAKFINELNRSVSGPITFMVPAGAKIDPKHTNITYKVIGERNIAGKDYLMINATVPVGVSQIVISKGPDTEKPELQLAYLQPTWPRANRSITVYFTATDNLGIRDIYGQVIGADGKPVQYGKVTRFPAEVGSGKPDNTFYTIEIPPLSPGKYRIVVTAVDYYGNKATFTKDITVPEPTSNSKSSTTTTTNTTSKKGICGPAFIVALAALPLILRRKR